TRPMCTPAEPQHENATWDSFPLAAQSVRRCNRDRREKLSAFSIYGNSNRGCVVALHALCFERTRRMAWPQRMSRAVWDVGIDEIRKLHERLLPAEIAHVGGNRLRNSGL